MKVNSSLIRNWMFQEGKIRRGPQQPVLQSFPLEGARGQWKCRERKLCLRAESWAPRALQPQSEATYFYLAAKSLTVLSAIQPIQWRVSYNALFVLTLLDREYLWSRLLFVAAGVWFLASELIWILSSDPAPALCSSIRLFIALFVPRSGSFCTTADNMMAI